MRIAIETDVNSSNRPNTNQPPVAFFEQGMADREEHSPGQESEEGCSRPFPRTFWRIFNGAVARIGPKIATLRSKGRAWHRLSPDRRPRCQDPLHGERSGRSVEASGEQRIKNTTGKLNCLDLAAKVDDLLPGVKLSAAGQSNEVEPRPSPRGERAAGKTKPSTSPFGAAGVDFTFNTPERPTLREVPIRSITRCDGATPSWCRSTKARPSLRFLS